jgi:glutamate-1-semialdehyde 2,1-aminomutase
MDELDVDREFFERELNSFVPPRIFDSHAHLYRKAFFSGTNPIPELIERYPEMDLACFQHLISSIMPGRRVSGVFFGWPHQDVNIADNNRFVADQAHMDLMCRAHMLVEPGMDPEYVRQIIRRQGFVGLKCYHVYSSQRPTFESSIPQYLPEEHVRIAHEEGLCITLHIVRSRAMADRFNQETIHTWATRYPNSRWILAHAARGFNPYHTIEGIGALAGLRNIWCDTSAVTEAGAFEAIVRTLGVDRLLYGSDCPVTHLRGRCVAIGDSFLWLSPKETNFHADYAEIQPALIGHESLRVLKLACWNLDLKDSEIEKIFYGNAAELYGLPA